MENRQYTVGEVAKATGLTVRTLQHYDNIGLLPASGRSEAGRRYYTGQDLLKLEQIIFYKSIGIPLKSIGEKLVSTHTLATLQASLEQHYRVLLRKIDSINLALSALDSALEIVKMGQYPPWEKLAGLIRAVDGSLMDWENFPFDEALYKTLEEQGITTLPAAMEFYQALRAMMVEASTLQAAGKEPGDPAAEQLAMRWWQLILGLTNGDEAATSALASVNEARDTWPEADRLLFEKAEPFLEAALEHYIVKNNIPVPRPLQDKEAHDDGKH